MLTDPQRTHRHIPGDPKVCPVFQTHKIFSTEETVSWADNGCRTAEIGCRDCKKSLKESLIERVAPIAERRAELEKDPTGVRSILERGADHAREVAGETMHEVRKSIGLE